MIKYGYNRDRPQVAIQHLNKLKVIIPSPGNTTNESDAEAKRDSTKEQQKSFGRRSQQL